MSIEERIQQLEANSGGFDICDLLEKHFFQRNGQDPISGEPWAENDEDLAHYRIHHEWESDGKPTGIKDDAEFYAIQRALFKEVIYRVENQKLDYKGIATRVYDFLKTLPDGTELSTHEAVDKALGKPKVQYKDYSGYTYYYGGTVIKEDDFWDIHYALLGKIGMGHKYEADFSKYEGQTVGLPYNIPFVFRLKRK